jgi:hypothetical protein
VSTTSLQTIVVNWDAATQARISAGRINELLLQYRVGTSGVFTSVASSGYQNANTSTINSGTGATDVTAKSVTLPSACDNQAVVQLRWIVRDVTGSGNRPSFSIDNVSVSGSALTTPSIVVSPTSLSGFSTSSGTVSASQSYTLSGSNLSPASGNLTVTAPSDYEVSTNNLTFSSSVNVAYTGGTLAATSIFVRIASSAGAGSPSGNVTNAGGGASTQNVAVSGLVCPAPSGTFSVGDLSIMGYLSDDPDGFSFVNWVSIPNGTSISFTDNGWTGSALTTNENTVVWQNNTGSAIAPGTVILLSNAGGTGTTDQGTIVSGVLSGISASDDNIFAYTGTLSCPEFIFGFSNAAWISTGVPTSNQSYLPAVLNVANGNLVMSSNLDNWEFSGSRSNQSTIAAYKPIVNNPANYTGNDSPFTLSSTDFTAASPALAVSPSSLSGFNTTSGTASASQTYALTGSDLSPASGNITITAPTGYEVSTDNSTFSGSVNVAYTGGTLATTTVYVRISASAAAGSPSGNVSNSGGGASTQNVAVSGSVCSSGGTLAVGDISIIGMLTDAPDGFSFVNWASIPVGAQLSFTDNAWTGTSLNTNENTLVWQNTTGSAIAPGTVIVVTDPGTATGAADLGTVTSGNLSGLSASNENIFVYQGSPACASFIYGLTNSPWITTGVPNTNNSYLPAALNVPNGNLVTTSTLDNWEYSSSRSNQGSIASYKPMVNTAANWTGNDNVTTLSSIDFTVGAVTTFPDLVINEVMYNSTGLDEEWVELYNWGTSPVVLSSLFTLENTNPAWTYTFPNVTVPSGGYLTIQVGSAGAFPFTADLVRSTSADQLVNSTSTIRLKKNGLTFDQVTYADASPWPTSPDGTGPSLSLKHPQADNTQASNWKSSCGSGGTPGAYNAVGTLRSVSTGNWPTNTTWQWKIEGTPNWTATPSTGFVISCQTDVTVRASHTVTIPSGHMASADDVTVSGTLLVDNVATLNVGDKLSIVAPGVLNVPTAAGSATVNVGGDLDNTNGTLNIGNLNVVNITGDYITAYINTILGSTAVMNVADDWIFTGGSDNQPVMTSGTVNMMGAFGTQEIGTTTFNNLVMQGAAPKQVAVGAKVSIRNKLELQEGALTTSAGQLILRSTATQTAYIDNFTDPTPGTLTGPIVMERYLPGGNNRYNYVGSAVQSPNIATELSEFQPYGTDGAQLLASVTCSSDSLFIGSPYGRLFEWRESASPGAYQPNCSTWRWHVRSSGTITSGMGLATLSTNGWGPITMSLSGIPHSGDVSTPALGVTGANSWSGWHMVANPFPSAWSWNPTSAGAQGFNGQVQFFQATGPYVGQYIGSVGPQVIASSQGFFIKRTSGSGSFTFNQSGRTAANPSFYAAVPWYESMFNLSLTGPNGADRTTVYLSDEATLGIDELWDADKLDGSTELPSLSSVASETRLSVNSMPALTAYEHRAVALSARPAAAGVFRLALEDMRGVPAELQIVLEDRFEKKMYDLRAAAYSYVTDGSDASDRFILHLNPPANQGSPEVSGLQIWADGAGFVTVRNSALATMAMLELTDMTGRTILSRANMALANGDTRFEVGNVGPGVYLVRITAADGTVTSRKVVLR